ncbi:hypothetical protein GGI12_001425 [Dipsacomyces acuminosporus]|nr:hypothetical protein GGI12_001425 [Dipsacomyces acuminosporus]
MELTPNVFEEGIYHMKACEIILHFLLAKLDSDRFKREFLNCWPICEPKQSREFRSQAFKWLEEIKKSNEWPVDVPIRRSYLDESKGLRFEQILWSLTRFVARWLLKHSWSRYLKHKIANDGDLREVRQRLESCQRRYSRQTKDRLRAQEHWKRSELELNTQVAQAKSKCDRVHGLYRSARKKLSEDIGDALHKLIDRVPGVDAAVSEVEETLGGLIADTTALWDGSFGWVESHKDAIDMVDSVVGDRANSVRLDAKAHLRLAPPPSMSNDWSRWLLDNKATPFRGSDVNLHVVSKMATACVHALRQHLSNSSSDQPALSLAGGGNSGLTELPDVSDKLDRLDSAIMDQNARIAKLERIKAQLVDQKGKVALRIRATGQDLLGDAGVECLKEAISGPVGTSSAALPAAGSKKTMGIAKERTASLAGRWSDLVHAESYSQSIADSAWPGEPSLSKPSVDEWQPKLPLSFASDSSILTPPTPHSLALPSDLSVARTKPSALLPNNGGSAHQQHADLRKRPREALQAAGDLQGGDNEVEAAERKTKRARAGAGASAGSIARLAAKESVVEEAGAMLVDEDVPEFLV